MAQKAALVVVDVQNDYTFASGALPCPGAEEIIATINEAISHHWAGGVVFTLDAKVPGDEGDSKWPAHCVNGTHGQLLATGLIVPPDAAKVEKRWSYSGFGRHDGHRHETTELESMLIARGVSHVVVVGLALEFCVLATAIDAVRRGFSVAVVLDGCRAYEPLSERARAVGAALSKEGISVFATFMEYFAATEVVV